VQKDPNRHESSSRSPKRAASTSSSSRLHHRRLARGGKAVWDKTFGPFKPANFGIGGDRTEHVIWRMRNGELEGIRPSSSS